MDSYYMREALKEAQKAYDLGEVPIGCVIVRGGEIIGRGYNRTEADGCAMHHGEIMALKEADRATEGWRIGGDLYVTVEPCPMCMGAILNSRIDRLIIGTDNPRFGAAGSVVNLAAFRAFNHSVAVTEGVLAEECRALMQSFFKSLR
ncbi:nucleoside deaminase [Aedoeadaptatus pacaensis]|uniref:nucleoside deaminase n=1 Tax=Aedoeadaptatus pacaensis TaxID=1776390 RepID=UPI000ABF382E|nr:nucleoside deaminase [Peptoniphilus pacaensis]